jgi:hypothetical protein
MDSRVLNVPQALTCQLTNLDQIHDENEEFRYKLIELSNRKPVKGKTRTMSNKEADRINATIVMFDHGWVKV